MTGPSDAERLDRLEAQFERIKRLLVEIVRQERGDEEADNLAAELEVEDDGEREHLLRVMRATGGALVSEAERSKTRNG
jgi:hypothetical protein